MWKTFHVCFDLCNQLTARENKNKLRDDNRIANQKWSTVDCNRAADVNEIEDMLLLLCRYRRLMLKIGIVYNTTYNECLAIIFDR